MLPCRLTSVASERQKRNVQPSLCADFSFTSSVPSHTFHFIFRVSYLQDIAFIVLLLFSLALNLTNGFSQYMSVQFRGFGLQSVDSPISCIHTHVHTYTHIHTHSKLPKRKCACAILTLKLHIHTLIGIGLCFIIRIPLQIQPNLQTVYTIWRVHKSLINALMLYGW